MCHTHLPFTNTQKCLLTFILLNEIELSISDIQILSSKDKFQTSRSRVTMEVSLKRFEEVFSRRPIISETILGY